VNDSCSDSEIVIGALHMLTDKQFNDSFTAAGGKFIANNFEYVADNQNKPLSEIVATLFLLGYDSNINGTRTRVSSMFRLFREDQGEAALRKIAASNRIDPNSVRLAQKILKERFIH